MAEKTAFVTGSTGFLGLNLVEQLCAPVDRRGKGRGSH